MNDRALADTLLEKGAQLIADYGSFQIFAAAPGQVSLPAPGLEDVSEQNVITLNAGPIDTLSEKARALRRVVGSFNGKRLHLVHFAGPIKPEWVAEIEQTGAQVVTYVPHNAYLIYADDQSLANLQLWAAGAPHVQWDGEYADGYKIHPRARTVDAKGQPGRPLTDWFAIQLVADDIANAASLQKVERLKLEPIAKQSRVLNYLNLIVRLPPERLNEIAAQPEVVSIQPYLERKQMDELQDQIMAGNLIGNSPSAPGYLAWLASKGFSQAQFAASGFAVDVSDSGIDNGTLTPGHFGLYTQGDLTQPSRLIYSRLLGIGNPGSTRQGCDGHGNLNAHVVAGYDGQFNTFPHVDPGGYRYGLGVCPFVNVGSSVIFDPNKFTYPDYPSLQSQAYNNGARISGNSWGASTAGDYDIDSQSYDALVRDAQPSGTSFPTTGNQEMAIVFAAGNDGQSGAQTVGSPGTAKNVITVGASENVRSLADGVGGNNPAGYDGCGEDDSGADSANDIAFFSSRGPCTDGRMKPDLVAPGSHITGGVAQSSPPPSPTGTGNAIPCFAASGVCGLPNGGSIGNPDNFFPLSQQFYTVSTGTSHSTPAVAGACALLRQYFLNLGSNAPSAAMTKAFLINSARFLSGDLANDSLWSPNQGMGAVNLGQAFDGAARFLRDQLAADKFTATGQTRTFTGVVSDPTKPFRVTVAWTDAPGSTTGNAFHNNLDLTVTIAGNTYKGNVFSGAFSTTGGSADTRNNVESVFLPSGISGSFQVTITAANINSDGVPNEAPSLDQDFALVIYNGAQALGPVLIFDTAVVTAESCSPANAAVDPNETVTVNFGIKNTGTTNTLNLIATLQATGGLSAVSGPQIYGALAPGGPAVARPFSFKATGACGKSVTASLQLQDSTNLGVVSLSIPLGQISVLFTQNFDSVTVPGLPSGWTTSASGAAPLWVTSTNQSDTAPNSAFTPNAANVGVNELVSPVILVSANSAQLSFRHNFDLENTFDGGVLEMKVGNGAFADILAAGGSFVSGGYVATLSTAYGNPLGGRQAWSGNSGNFITTVVNLPASATGQNVQFRWRCATDQSAGASGWYVDSVAVSGRICCGFTISALPLLTAGSAALVSEGCAPTNGVADPGETVTFNFGLLNAGAGNGNNVVATLLATNGVNSPGGPQSYGSMPSNGAQVLRSFTFTASGSCGDIISPVLQLQDGAQDLGMVSFPLQLGQFSAAFSENFDGVNAPALPTGWTTSSSGAQSAWVSTTTAKDSLPNSVFSPDPSGAGVNELVSPVFLLPPKTVELSFRHNYDLEEGTGNSAYDGGVLEIKIGSGSFTDIITAGGSFTTGAYTHTLSSSYGNPLGGRRAWSGSSGGFTTTVLTLPPAAAGQNIQLRWRCASDASTGAGGWYVDTISLIARTCCGEILPPIASFSATPTNGGKPLTVNFTEASGGTITNRFWTFGNGSTTNSAATSFSVVYTNVGTYSVSLAASGPLGTNQLTRTNYIVVTNPVPFLVSNGLSIAAESCTNAAIDPGETVTLNFGLINLGTGSTTNLVATLQSSGGVTPLSGPQTYGALSGGASVNRSFSLVANGICGTPSIGTLQLQDGSANLGTVSFSFVLGTLGPLFTQNFDSVSAPALPSGWTTSATGAATVWKTAVDQADTLPNSAFSPSASSPGVADLISPAFAIPAGAARLSFRHSYNMEGGSGGTAFDGGVLDVKIGNGQFTDIVTAGGSFLTNGYAYVISSSFSNSLAGRQAWSGNSGGFVTTIVNLPAAAANQNVQFRWRCGSDQSFAQTGWHIDSVAINGSICCGNAPLITTQPQNQVVLVGSNATFSVTAGGTAPLGYQWRFSGTSIGGGTASSFTRSNAQLKDAGSYDVIVTNTFGSVTSMVAALSVVNRPVLNSSQKSPGGSFNFTLVGTPGYNYAFESSTNLSQWTLLGTLSNVNGQVQFSDTGAGSFRYRFYRARVVP